MLLVVLPLALSACKNVVPRQTPFMENVGDVDMSSRELRVRVVEFGRHFSATVELAADEIIRASGDEQVRRNALRWKMQAIPAAQEASLQVDPLMSLVDLWAFSMQMVDHFESGAGMEDFGSHQSVAVRAAKEIEADAAGLARRVSVSGDIARHESEIRSWSRNHPIEHSFILRDSVIGSGADLLGEQGGAFALVEDMNATTREMANRLSFYNEYLLKQVQWTAELMASDVMSGTEIDSLAVNLTSALAASSLLLENVPGLVEGERLEVLAAIARERELVFEAISLQRIATIRALRQERIATLAELSEERAIVLEALRGEREIVMAALEEMMQRMPDESRSIVDHAVWRIGQLLALFLLGLLLLSLFVLLVWRLSGGFGRRHESLS